MNKKWWNDKIAYQIYPKSFCDSNGDGIGDLKGIISKLDYLKALGIDVIWLSPVYKSPFVDQGYDISDYYAIAEEFGTMEDFDTLLCEMKKRNMHLLMDLVVNHCSDRHEWFKKALQNPYGEYAQRFYFVKGKNGAAPSNYRSYFGGSVWEKVEGTDMYYLHMFAKEQPDLNWENPVVRKKIYNMVNWWLEKGLAGFRIDAIINIKKDPEFPSYPPDGEDGLVYCGKSLEHIEGIGEFLQELKRETFDKYDAFTVGEVFNNKEKELEEFVGENGHFSTMFDFSSHLLTAGENGWYDAKPINFRQWRSCVFASQAKMQNIGFLANIIENHDEPRGASRFLPKYAQNDNGKKMLADINIMLRGIPFIYQGQEIGMVNCPFDDVSEYNDINTIDQYNVAINAGFSHKQAMQFCFENSRDNARTPMQWSDAINAGFTTGTPWLKVNPNYIEINVEAQEKDENSVLCHYRKLTALRKNPLYKDTFTYGTTVPEYEEFDGIFAYYRVNEETGQRVMIAANFGENTAMLPAKYKVNQVLLSNTGKEKEKLEGALKTQIIQLESCESIIILC